MNRLSLLFLLVILLPLWASAHGDRIDLDMTGVVNDALTSKPLQGAVISLEKNGQTIYSTRTDEGGNFSIRFEGPLGRHDQLEVTITKKGYSAYNFPPLDLKQRDISIRLKRKSPIPILKPVNKAPLIAI